MADPLTASRILVALEDEGLTVVEVGQWRTHNRNSRGAWGPVHGVMTHHTVTSGSAATVRILRDGYNALPGPLCLAGITKDGTIHLLGYGRANHAGLGDDDVLRAVIAERHPLPSPNERNTDGNARFYGFECENLGDGEDPWPRVQYVAMVKANAAICRAHGWTAGSCIGHKEWTNRKIDPRGIDMDDFRRDIDACLALPAGQWNGGKENDMTISDADAEKIARAMLTLDGEIDAPWGTPTNQTWQLNSVLTHVTKVVLRTEVVVRELAAQGAARDAVLAWLAEGGGLDAAETQRVAQAGAQAALDRLAIALAAEADDE